MRVEATIRGHQPLLNFLSGLTKRLDDIIASRMNKRVKAYIQDLTAYPSGGNLGMNHGRQWVRGVGLMNSKGEVLRGRVSYAYGGGDLRSWMISRTLRRNELTYKLVAMAPYAIHVAGDDYQTWFHKRTGWKRVTSTLENHKLEIVDEILSGVDKVLGEVPKI